MEKSDKLKDAVKEKYAQLAKEKKSCCCNSKKETDLSVFNEKYEGQEGYVEEANLNLGCGIPTEFAGMKPGDSVLDLGCGAGNDCFVARRIVGETGSVTGLDFTDEMLAKAKSNNYKLGYENVSFVKGDIENVPLKDSMFDVVISNCVLNLVSDKAKAFSEIFRLLKPGGRFCVSDIVLNGELPENIRETAALYAGCVSGALQKDQYIKTIHDTGFQAVEIKKNREIIVPDEMFLQHVSETELQKFKSLVTGIFSITVVGLKSE